MHILVYGTGTAKVAIQIICLIFLRPVSPSVFAVDFFRLKENIFSDFLHQRWWPALQTNFFLSCHFFFTHSAVKNISTLLLEYRTCTWYYYVRPTCRHTTLFFLINYIQSNMTCMHISRIKCALCMEILYN